MVSHYCFISLTLSESESPFPYLSILWASPFGTASLQYLSIYHLVSCFLVIYGRCFYILDSHYSLVLDTETFLSFAAHYPFCQADDKRMCLMGPYCKLNEIIHTEPDTYETCKGVIYHHCYSRIPPKDIQKYYQGLLVHWMFHEYWDPWVPL